MKRLTRTAALSAAVMLCTTGIGAQQPPDSTARRQQRTIDSLASALRATQARIDSMAQSAGDRSAPQPAQPAPQARPAGAYMNVSFVGLTDFAWSTTPKLGELQLGDHEPHVRGFAIPNGELALDGTVDPYFKAFANVVY